MLLTQVHILATDGGALVQIMHASVSKESAVTRVLDDMGISPAEAMVFGDDVNDVGLFRLCGSRGDGERDPGAPRGGGLYYGIQ